MNDERYDRSVPARPEAEPEPRAQPQTSGVPSGEPQEQPPVPPRSLTEPDVASGDKGPPPPSRDRPGTGHEPSPGTPPRTPPPPPPSPHAAQAYDERARRRRESSLPYKSPALAAVLSCMPGLGQVYVGYYQQGFQFMLIAAATITILNVDLADAITPLLGFFLSFFWIFNILDAHRRAHHYNRALDGLSGDTVPDDFKLPSASGSLPAGVVLVVLGVLILLDLNTDLSMAWLEDWWPVALIAGGGWLIYKARRPVA